MTIRNGEVCILYVMRHEALSPEMETHRQDMLLRKITVSFITCRTTFEITTRGSHPLLSSQSILKQNIKSPTTLAAHQDETSRAAHFSLPRMTTMSQPEQCSPLNGKVQQFLKKAAFPSVELQTRNEREAQQKVDKELRKKLGIVKEIRIHLKRINPSELKEDSGKASPFKWKFPKKAASPSEELQSRTERVAQQKDDNELRRKFGIVKDIRIHLKRLKF